MPEASTPSPADGISVHSGDCRAVLARLPDAFVDAAVTDPPYHLTSIVQRFGAPGAAPARSDGATGVYARSARGFMGQAWDGGAVAFDPETWGAVARVMKPGAHLCAFGHPRTVHRLACAIEDAGLEIRDTVVGLADPDRLVTAFVDSLDPRQREALAAIAALDGLPGWAGWVFGSGFPKSRNLARDLDRREGPAGAVDPAVDGSGRADRERRPGSDRPVSELGRRWAGWGTALKPAVEPIVIARKPIAAGSVAANLATVGVGGFNIAAASVPAADGAADAAGRWPANLVHDGSGAATAVFPIAPGQRRAVSDRQRRPGRVYGAPPRGIGRTYPRRGDHGSAARFFYAAKAGPRDRAGSRHPTIKPIALMRWLIRLVTPPGGHVLDPFAGSGTTGEAALLEGVTATLIEREPDYIADIHRRLARARGGDTPLFGDRWPDGPTAGEGEA